VTFVNGWKETETCGACGQFFNSMASQLLKTSAVATKISLIINDDIHNWRRDAVCGLTCLIDRKSARSIISFPSLARSLYCGANRQCADESDSLGSLSQYQVNTIRSEDRHWLLAEAVVAQCKTFPRLLSSVRFNGKLPARQLEAVKFLISPRYQQLQLLRIN
jgi:hypothetical protein